ncbi:MAG: glycosyltransferase family 2 protein [Chloroflexota bacterium]|nr:glycosyltransferase family 2 protein [Chloroflexota bacterium]
MTTAPRVLALIPAFDEAARIGPVIAATARHLPVLVVDDGSMDGTAAEAEAAGAAVIRQHPNQGKGTALQTGFRRAIADGFEAVVTLDADGQHDPAEIPSFVDAWMAAAAVPDLVIGRRDFGAMPLVRRLSNRLGSWAFAWAVGRDVPDNQSGYRLVTRRLMEATLASDEAGFEFEVEMIVTCIRAGWGLAWVPIRTIYAGEPSHIRPWRHFRSFLGIVRKARRTVRLPLR